mgnify:CR=1 FL=1
MRILRGVAALFAVGAILIGGPWALIGFGRLDALTRLGGARPGPAGRRPIRRTARWCWA